MVEEPSSLRDTDSAMGIIPRPEQTIADPYGLPIVELNAPPMSHHALSSADSKKDEDDGHRTKRIKQEQANTDVGRFSQSPLGSGSSQAEHGYSQSTGETRSTNGAEDSSTTRSMRTDITTPQEHVVASIDAGITQPNDLSCIYDAANYYEKLENLELETA